MADNVKSILAVDDAYTNLQIVHGLLKDSFHMHLAKSGRMALIALERMTPDLILLDIEMPEISGFNIMETINANERLKKIPVIFVTAHASKDFVITASRQGAKDYLVKPFDPELLRAKIRNALKDSGHSGNRGKAIHSHGLIYDEYDLENDMKILYLNNMKKTFSVHMKIIGDLLDYYEVESARSDLMPTYFDLKEFFNGIESFNRLIAESKGLVFQSDFDADLPHVIFGDEIRINQILVDMLGNVIHYTDRGYIRFSVELITDDEDAEGVVFCVEGSVLDVIEHDFTKIHEKFERMQREKNQNIVNVTPVLPIARQLAEMIGADIYFNSARDKGSAFTVELPLQTEEREPNRSKELLKQVKVKAGIKILVVDDNPVNLKIAVSMLAKHGVASDTAQSGEKAVKLMQEAQYDLIFMDHLMPGMDGAATTKAIRALGGEYCGEVPIIALSAYNAVNARDLFLRSGMNDFITKPIDDAELNMALKNWLPREKLLDGNPDAGQNNENPDEFELNELLNRVSTAGSQELSIVRGLKSVGGDKKLYVEVLAHFCNWIENDMRLLMEAVKHKRWKDYAIRVHALKTVLANIGDELMSDWAASLEKAAAEGDTEKCVRETEYFQHNIMKLHSRLAGVFQAKQPKVEGSKKKISAEKLNDLLLKITGACLICFVDQAGCLTKELKEFSFDDETDAAISKIYDYVDSYDFDKAYGAIQTILEKLTVGV